MLYNEMAIKDNGNKFYRKKALESMLKGIDIAEANKLFSASPDYGNALRIIAALYMTLGDKKNGCSYFDKAVAYNDQKSIELKKEGLCL